MKERQPHLQLQLVVALDADVGAFPPLRPLPAVFRQERVETLGPRVLKLRDSDSRFRSAVARDVRGDPVESRRVALLPRGRRDRTVRCTRCHPCVAVELARLDVDSVRRHQSLRRLEEIAIGAQHRDAGSRQR